MRSRNCRPRLVYFLAIEMTRRRLASTISFLAMRASRSALCPWLPMRRKPPGALPGGGRGGVALVHSLLGAAGFALGLLHLVGDAAELAERHAGGLADLADLAAD